MPRSPGTVPVIVAVAPSLLCSGELGKAPCTIIDARGSGHPLVTFLPLDGTRNLGGLHLTAVSTDVLVHLDALKSLRFRVSRRPRQSRQAIVSWDALPPRGSWWAWRSGGSWWSRQTNIVGVHTRAGLASAFTWISLLTSGSLFTH